jgi:hypothetical protein
MILAINPSHVQIGVSQLLLYTRAIADAKEYHIPVVSCGSDGLAAAY